MATATLRVDLEVSGHVTYNLLCSACRKESKSKEYWPQFEEKDSILGMIYIHYITLIYSNIFIHASVFVFAKPYPPSASICYRI